MGGISLNYIDHWNLQRGLFSENGQLFFVNRRCFFIGAGLWPKDPKKRIAEMASTVSWTWDAVAPPQAWLMWWLYRAKTVTTLYYWEHPLVQGYGFNHLGFVVLWQGDSAALFAQRGVAVPWWFLTAVFALRPGRLLAVQWKRRRWRAAGLCPDCGYDMRATPHRCPECGRAVAP